MGLYSKVGLYSRQYGNYDHQGPTKKDSQSPDRVPHDETLPCDASNKNDKISFKYFQTTWRFLEDFSHLLSWELRHNRFSSNITKSTLNHTHTRNPPRTHPYSFSPTTVDLNCVIFHSKSEDPHTATFCHSNVDLSDSNEDLSETLIIAKTMDLVLHLLWGTYAHMLLYAIWCPLLISYDRGHPRLAVFDFSLHKCGLKVRGCRWKPTPQ